MCQTLFQPCPISIFCLFAALLSGGCSDEKNFRETAPARPIEWTEVRPHEPEMRWHLPGVVRSVKRAELSFKVGGKVERINVDVGDSFDKGDLLASLEIESFELEVQRAGAALLAAQAVATEAREELQRQEALVARGFASDSMLDQARAQENTATSRSMSAQSSLAIAKVGLEDTQLLAPYDGEVSGRLIEPRRQVGPGQPVLRVQGADDSREVRVLVPETLIEELKTGSAHPVTFPAKPDLQAEGRIIEIGTDANDTGTYPVTLLLDPAPRTPRPGMTAEVAFYARHKPGSSDDLTRIPVTAFLPVSQNETVAFVYDAESSRVVRRVVTITDISNHYALVGDGLRVGERIATRGLAFLSDGQKVTLLGMGPARSEQTDFGDRQ